MGVHERSLPHEQLQERGRGRFSGSRAVTGLALTHGPQEMLPCQALVLPSLQVLVWLGSKGKETSPLQGLTQPSCTASTAPYCQLLQDTTKHRGRQVSRKEGGWRRGCGAAMDPAERLIELLEGTRRRTDGEGPAVQPLVAYHDFILANKVSFFFSSLFFHLSFDAPHTWQPLASTTSWPDPPRRSRTLTSTFHPR